MKGNKKGTYTVWVRFKSDFVLHTDGVSHHFYDTESGSYVFVKDGRMSYCPTCNVECFGCLVQGGSE